MASEEPTKHLVPLTPFNPDLHERAWSSAPHPTLPLLATVHAKSVTVFSLASLSSHSSLTGGHTRSVRSAAWKPNLPPSKLCLVTGSFDSTAGLVGVFDLLLIKVHERLLAHEHAVDHLAVLQVDLGFEHDGLA